MAKFKTENRAYFFATGKRKSAIATVRLYPEGEGNIEVNEETLRNWSDEASQYDRAMRPLAVLSAQKDYDAVVIVRGGGKSAQSEAIQLGIARALEKKDGTLREQLKKEDLLTRDSRVKERKKPGLRKARRAVQFSKR